MPVNFLPESYLQRRDLRQVKRKCVLLGLGGVLVIAAWGMVQFSATTRLGAKAEALAAEAQAAERMQLELTRLRDQHGSLLQQVEVGRELSMPLHQAEVIRLLSDVLPEEVVLSELNIQTVRPAPEPIQMADANPSQVRPRFTLLRSRVSATPNASITPTHGINFTSASSGAAGSHWSANLSSCCCA